MFSLKYEKPNILATCVGSYQEWPNPFTSASIVGHVSLYYYLFPLG